MSEPSDVVLLVFDTVRYDALSRHGCEAETPNIDSVAGRGVDFTDAYSTGPSTDISHSSLFTN